MGEDYRCSKILSTYAILRDTLTWLTWLTLHFLALNEQVQTGKPQSGICVMNKLVAHWGMETRRLACGTRERKGGILPREIASAAMLQVYGVIQN